MLGVSALIRFVTFILFIFLTGVPQGAFAQQREIFDLFGGMIRSGIAAATQADWERLPGSEVACVDAALRPRGSSINEMIRQGVSPSDPRMSGIRNQCRNQSNASGPSFDCRRARSADEIAICGDPELARLDRLIGQGYQELLVQIGEGPARSMAAPLLAARRACGADVGCIKTAQLSTIKELQRRGATIANPEPAPIAPVPLAQTPQAEAPYIVDGLHLGGHVKVGSPSYLEYRCGPSEQFGGLTWCQRRRQEISPRGAYSSTTTIVHSDDGTALYVNRYLEPAFFAGTEAMDDVRRLSAKYGEPRYVTPPVAVGPRTLMATWGDVSLQPLDRARLADLAAGRDVRAGILVDHIGNFQRSASIGLPVYRVTGGAGYVWAASWDPAGRGTLRFLTIDPSRLLPVASAGAPDMAANPATPQLTPPTAESSSPPPAPIASPPAAQPTSQPSPTPTVALSSPVIADQLAQAQNSKSESSAKPLEPAPVAPAITPVSPNKQPVPAEAAPAAAARPADTGRQAPPTRSANDPVQPRVVGPPIAIQPAAKTPETNYLQWALVAAVLILIGAVGFLLFDRRKKIDPISSPPTAPMPALMDVKLAEPSTMASSEDKALHPEEPERAAPTMQEPPSLPIELPEAAPTGGTSDANASAPAPALQGSDVRRSSNITEHRHFGIGLIAAIVALSALMSMSVGLAGMIPLALAVYLLPTIIAFKVRHHYAWVLGILNVVFGFTVLGWLGFFVWALIGPRKSALDRHVTAFGARPGEDSNGRSRSNDVGLRPALRMEDARLAGRDLLLRGGWSPGGISRFHQGVLQEPGHRHLANGPRIVRLQFGSL
ncbi:hypothetical protein ACVWWO_005311 [Bradyrhizobium sp. F1.13.1]